MAFELCLKPKMQCHHDQSYVVLPGGLVAGLVLVHAELLLGFLKHALNPVALHLPVQGLSPG